MLEISHRNGSYSNPLLGPRLVSTSCQTDETSTQPDILTQEDDDYSAFNPILAVSPTSAASLSTASPTYSTSPRASSGGKNLAIRDFVNIVILKFKPNFVKNALENVLSGNCKLLNSCNG